jgi:hypothetical protein
MDFLMVQRVRFELLYGRQTIVFPRRSRRNPMPGGTSSLLRLKPSGVTAIAEHEIIEFEGADEY